MNKEAAPCGMDFGCRAVAGACQRGKWSLRTGLTCGRAGDHRCQARARSSSRPCPFVPVASVLDGLTACRRTARGLWFVTASTPLKRRTSHYRPGFPLCRSTSSTSPKGTQAQFSQLSLLVERPCWSAARREVVEMRRIVVVLVLGLVVGVWPAASGVAHGATAAQAAPARSLQADFNNDGADDLAVGVPFENVGSIVAAGAVNVLYGSPTGLTTIGSQFFTQVAGAVETDDEFGFELAAGDFNPDTFADLAAGAPFEDVGSRVDAGAVSVLPGSAGGLTAVGGQLFTQVAGTVEAGDQFGFALATGDFN